MIINFRYLNSAYTGVLDSLINPIIKYLPEGSYQFDENTVKGALNVNFFREEPDGRGVFISHGIADKNWRNAEAVEKYDYVFVSGDSWKEKLIQQGLPEEKICVVGYTKLDPIYNGEIKRNESNKMRILFAPTHKAVPKLSLDGQFDEYLDKFPDNCEIIDSRHPAIQKGDILPTMQGLVDCDAVISDCSSLVYEGMLLGKPVLFADWLVKENILKAFPASFESLIYMGFEYNGKHIDIGLHAENFEEMLYNVRRINNYKFNMMEKSLMNGILPKRLRGNSGEVTAKKLLELARM
jgi:CDP-glycerol glycerophosphotransferase (TagB/SpsB family)